MASTKINGVILTENNFGDYDKMLTILTPNLGKISCVAKGARRTKSALLAPTQMFCFGEYMVYKGANTYNINSADTIEVFYNIRTDYDKLNTAVMINKMVKEVTEENQNSYNILQLLLNTLYVISETNKDLDLIISIFKFRLVSLVGYRPEIEKCKNCGQEECLEYFSIKDSGFKCKSCGNIDKSTIQISESTKNAIKYSITAPAKKIYGFDLKADALKEFSLISKIYFEQKIEKEIK